MSRSTFLKTSSSSFEANEAASHSPTTIANTDHTHALRFHHRLMPTVSPTNRSNEIVPVVLVQSSSTTTTDSKITTTNTTQRKSVVRINPTVKRNLRGKRRSTGIRPDEVSLASAAVDLFNQEEEEEEDSKPPCNQFITITSTEPSESFDLNRTSPPKPVFKVSRVQPTFDENSHRSFEKLNITRPDPFVMASSSSAKAFRTEEFILRRQGSEDDPASIKRRQLEERIHTLESLVHDKDSIIQDLQRKLDKATRDLSDAEQQIYILQRDKLTLAKTLSTIQESKSSSGGGGDHPITTKRTGFISRK